MGNLYLTEADDLSQKTLDISTWNSSLGNLLMIFELLFANLCHFCMENFFVDERCHRHVRWANDDWELNDVNLNDCDWLRNITPLQRGILSPPNSCQMSQNDYFWVFWNTYMNFKIAQIILKCQQSRNFRKLHSNFN